MKRTWKALAFLAAMAGAALALSTAAFAVGGSSSPSPARLRVSLGPIAWSGRLTALYPGVRGDSELLGFTVTNTGHRARDLSWVRALIPYKGDNAESASGAQIRGCRASWFTVVVDRADRPLPTRLAAQASYRGRVALAMRDSGSNQNACRGAAPAVSVTAG